METLFRVQLSPVPTQMFLWFEGSIVTAPIDWAGSRSNTGLNVVAPLMDFHTPPLADPTNTVILPFSSTASIAAMRPLIVAEPMFLAVNPEMVPESYFTGAGACAEAARHRANSRAKTGIERSEKGRRAIVIIKFLSNVQIRCLWAPIISVLAWLRPVPPGLRADRKST